MDLKEEFAEHGFVRLPGMFSGDQMKEFVRAIKTADPKREGPDHLDAGALRFHANLFYKSAFIREFIAQQSLIDVLVPLLGPNIWVRWDQAVEKGPYSGVFPWHQDNGYSRIADEHIQVWIALSKMTAQNGGLWLVPGSHKRRLPHRKRRNHVAAVGSERYDEPDAPKVLIRAAEGDVVIFSSLTLHKTYENTTDEARWAYVAEYLRVGAYDPNFARTYFVVARDGRSNPQFVNRLPGNHTFCDHLRHSPFMIRRYCTATAHRLADAFGR
jgi:ectoine hydroxylase-related dioxygenase (phytanoyl-CoA dioxygenase family)